MMRGKLKFGRVLIYVVLTATALLFALPAWLALITSFKSLSEIQTGDLLSFPAALTGEAWRKAWSSACTGPEACQGLSHYFRNSFIIVVPAALLSTLWAGFNGYILSRWRFKGSEFVFFILMFGAFFPWALYLLPLSRIVNELGMSDSMLGLIIVHIIYSLPQALFFRHQFIGFSDEVVKAARIDGAGLFTIFWRIVLPANREIFVVVLIIQFTAIWNDFLFALVLSPYDQQPVTVGINNLTNVQMGQSEHNVYMAGAFIAALPVIILYLVAGKFFVRGLGIGVAKN